MASPKYPAQHLTEEDKEILDKVVFKYAITFFNLMQEFPNAKDFAKKVVSKASTSDKYIATLYTLTYIKNSPSNQILRPGEINEALANDIKNHIQQDVSVEVEKNESNHKKFLNPRDLREGVLKKIEEHDTLLHYEGKQEIRDQLRKRGLLGKKSLSALVPHSHGGKLSVYLVKEDVDKLKRVMEKPEALEYLHTKVIGSGLAHEIMKYFMLMMFYAVKMDEEAALRLVGAGASFFQDKMNQQHEIEFKKLRQILQSINGKQLEQNVDDIAKSLIHDLGYYTILIILGLLRL